jgi:hypothetical protein
MGDLLKFIKIRKYVQVALIQSLMTLMLGCGGGGEPAINNTVSKSASISVTPLTTGSYGIQGNNMDGVAGIELTISYDNSALAAPTVTQGDFISGALMAANANTPGTIKIAIVSTKTFSGSGQIVTISFAGISASGASGITISSAKMINSAGMPIP